MKHITLLLSILLLITISCKKELKYVYSDKEDTIICSDETINSRLFKEALYTFEDYIKETYSHKGATKSVIRGYQTYMTRGINGSLPQPKTMSKHLLDVFEALKNEPDLWVTDIDGKHKLNYNPPVITCIGNNIKDKNIQITFQALINTSSMNSKLFGTPLRPKIGSASKDKYLSTFIALDMFYSRLFNIDFSKVKFEEKQPEDKEGINRPVQTVQPKPEEVDRSGHIHD